MVNAIKQVQAYLFGEDLKLLNGFQVKGYKNSQECA